MFGQNPTGKPSWRASQHATSFSAMGNPVYARAVPAPQSPSTSYHTAPRGMFSPTPARGFYQDAYTGAQRGVYDSISGYKDSFGVEPPSPARFDITHDSSGYYDQQQQAHTSMNMDSGLHLNRSRGGIDALWPQPVSHAGDMLTAASNLSNMQWAPPMSPTECTHYPSQGHVPVGDDDEAMADNDTRVYKCSCGKIFKGAGKNARANRKRHIKSKNEGKVFECPYADKGCEYIANREDNLGPHKKKCRFNR